MLFFGEIYKVFLKIITIGGAFCQAAYFVTILSGLGEHEIFSFSKGGA